MFEDHFSMGIISRAIEEKIVDVNPIDLRDYTTDRSRTTDDYQFGGGQGLVMKPAPLFKAVNDIKEKNPGTRVVLMDPRGKKFDQRQARRLAEYDNITLVCGRYEGFDERFVELCVDESISIGDFILTGGEIAAMTVIDSVVRLHPGVLGDENSPLEESHENGLLEYPHYTRPASFEGLDVPEVLTSGHHAKIDQWRRERSLETTALNRPDMLAGAKLSENDRKFLYDFYKEKRANRKVYVALMHYPMKDKQKDIVSTALTNMDLHDISRSCTTYGVQKYYIVTPLQAQREIGERVLKHWREGYGSKYNANRKQAFSVTDIRESLLEVIDDIHRADEKNPVIVATTARPSRSTVGYQDIAAISDERPILLLFGTGWGFTEDIFQLADHVLDPIETHTGFNHLSVRSAVAIILDRINRF